MHFWTTLPCPGPTALAGDELAKRGLVRISLGVESGDPDVRGFYHKYWEDEQLRLCCRRLQIGGTGHKFADARRRGGRGTSRSPC